MDTASTVPRRRQQYHRRVAQVLVARFPEVAEMRPEYVAHHYTEAGLAQEAVEYWQRAGQRAVQRSAYAEAVAHFRKALELLPPLPDATDRAQRELDLQVALGMALIPLKSWSGAEVGQAFRRARELCQQVGDSPLSFGALCGQCIYYIGKGDHNTGKELAEQCVALAERAADSDLLVEAYRVLGVASYWRGEFASARTYAEKILAAYDPDRHRVHAFLYGQDPAVAGEFFLVGSLLVLGYLDQARAVSHRSLAYARQLGHPFSIGYALRTSAMVPQFLFDWPRLQEAAEAEVSFATEQGFAVFLAWGRNALGYALARLGQPTEGLALLQRGSGALRAMGSAFATTYSLAWIAETLGLTGQVEAGLEVLAEALRVTETNGARLMEAELYRVQAELLLKREIADEQRAEACLLRAIDVARKQQAKLLELRAAVALARLWHRHGRSDDARRLLAEVYAWFTEGFDTPALKEAKALLDELA